jgi:hypothetical protein
MSGHSQADRTIKSKKHIRIKKKDQHSSQRAGILF